MQNKKQFSPEQQDQLIRSLKARFENNMNQHQGMAWNKTAHKIRKLGGVLFIESLIITGHQSDL